MWPEIPYEARPGEKLEQVVRHIYLPPADSLALDAGKSVMVVVPALPQRDDGQDETIFATVVGLKSLISHQVGQRVNEKCPMIEQRGAGKKPPGKHLKPAGVKGRRLNLKELPEAKEGDGQEEGGHLMMPVQPLQLPITSEVLDLFLPRRKIFFTQHPANVRPPKTPAEGRMNVIHMVGRFVMMPVVGRPP